MNKYTILIVVGVLILGGGILYRAFLLPEASKPVESGNVIEVTITAKKNEWRFTPENIEVARGDRVKIAAINEDDYDHGIAIDAYGISQRMPAGETVHLELVATQEGDFPFYCSVPCGEGIVDGVKRTHFDMIGTLQVRSLINKTE